MTRRRKRRTLGVVALAAGAVLATACSSDDGGSDESSSENSSRSGAGARAVTVTGPIEGGTYGVAYNTMPVDFAGEYGYSEEEFFVEGEATSYKPIAPLSEDGEWQVEPDGTAPYKTRIIVRRPVDPDAFNGVAVIEWLNVTSGRDADPDFGFFYPEIFEGGYAYVGVSAQATGVEGGGAVLDIPGVPAVALAPLKDWDNERYGSLDHPGDEYSYDVYTQIAQLIEAGGENDPLGGLQPEYVLGVGESQSAGRLVTYVNAVQPLANGYDGILIHSRGDSGAALSTAPDDAPPDVVAIRTDLSAPVLQFETETDLLRLGFLAARQPDTETVRTWEVAGTAHADSDTLAYGQASGQVWYDGPRVDFRPLCGLENTGQQAPVSRAALEALRAWTVDETLPSTSSRIETTSDDIVVDEFGNAVGGIRTPSVDAPVSTLTGKGNEVSIFCSLFGQTTPFTPEQLASLYPTHADYVDEVTASADAAADAGFLLPADRDVIVEEAEAANVPPR
ncbi:MAG: alpha/beta hydrolase domain-containing protein [Acidimicrobiia bacterium]